MNTIKKVFGLLLIMLMITGGWGSMVLAATVNDDQTVTLKIIHTNDTHSVIVTVSKITPSAMPSSKP